MYFAALTITIAVFTFAEQKSANSDENTVIHLHGNVQFPPTSWQLVRHTFRLHVPKNSEALTQLLIDVPDNITVSDDVKDIKVLEENEQKINTNVSVNGKTILLTFSDPVAPNTQFNIDLNNVKQKNRGNGHIYRFRAKVVGSKTDIPIGLARFQIY